MNSTPDAPGAWFDDLTDAEAEGIAARAEALFREPGWLESLLAPMLAALARDPLADPPLRFQRDGARATIVLHEGPSATLSLGMRRAGPMADSIVASGRLAVLHVVRSGGATLARWSADPVGESPPGPARALEPVPLADGQSWRIDGRREAALLIPGESPAVTVTASIHTGAAPLVRAWRRADGGFLRAASGDDRASRNEILLRFLRAAGRRDAVPAFDAASRDMAYPLRWAAMREWLALDAGSALPRLRAMAEQDPHAQVRAAAARTLERIGQRQGNAACRR